MVEAARWGRVDHVQWAVNGVELAAGDAVPCRCDVLGVHCADVARVEGDPWRLAALLGPLSTGPRPAATYRGAGECTGAGKS